MSLQSGKKTRWTKTSSSAKLLRQDFVSGAISSERFNPKEVQQTRAEYLEYDTNCFSRNLMQIAMDFAKVAEAGSSCLDKWLEDGKTSSDQHGK